MRTALAWDASSWRFSDADPTTSPKPGAFNGSMTISIKDTESSEPSQVNTTVNLCTGVNRSYCLQGCYLLCMYRTMLLRKIDVATQYAGYAKS